LVGLLIVTVNVEGWFTNSFC